MEPWQAHNTRPAKPLSNPHRRRQPPGQPPPKHRENRMATPAKKPQPAQPTPPAQPAQPAQRKEPVEAVTYRAAAASMRYPAAPHGSIKFSAGQYTTTDPDEIAYLDERDSCERA